MSMLHRDAVRLHQRVLTNLYWSAQYWYWRRAERAFVAYALRQVKNNDIVYIHPDEESDAIAELRLLVPRYGDDAHSHVEGMAPSAMQAAARAVDAWLRKGYAEATMGGERVEVHPGEAAVIAYFEELAEEHAS